MIICAVLDQKVYVTYFRMFVKTRQDKTRQDKTRQDNIQQGRIIECIG